MKKNISNVLVSENCKKKYLEFLGLLEICSETETTILAAASYRVKATRDVFLNGVRKRRANANLRSLYLDLEPDSE